MPGMLRGLLHACARGGKFLWYPTVLLTGHYVKLGIGKPFIFYFFALSIKASCRAAVLRCSCPGPVQEDPCQANKEAFVLTEQ